MMVMRTRVFAVLSLIVILLTGAACASTSKPSATNSLVIHASKTQNSILNLPNGGLLIIPAGAMTDGATVTATFTNPPTGGQADQAPIGTQVHFSVTPTNALLQPLALEFPLPSNASPAAARFGAYAIGAFDPSTRQWISIDTTYDPISYMLVAHITSVSSLGAATQRTNGALSARAPQLDVSGWWSAVQQHAHDAAIIVKCIPSALGSGLASTSWTVTARQFLTCVAKEKLSDMRSDLMTRVLTALLPKDCWSALVIDGLVTGPEDVLKGIFTEPACTGQAGETISSAIVSQVEPATGSTAGGYTVTIYGIQVDLATKVLFGGVPATPSIVVKHPGVITVTAPAHAAGIVNVQVQTSTGTSPITTTDQYTYVATSASTPPSTHTTAPPSGPQPPPTSPSGPPPSGPPPSGPPPAESIQIGWSSAHPTYIWMTLTGFPVGSYPYTCSFSTGGNATFTLKETTSPQTWDNGLTCYDTVAGDVVWVQIGSVSSNKITVPGAPPPPSPPPPSESIQIGWSSTHPTWIWMTMTGFPVGSYQYTCSFSTGGNATFTLRETTSPESWDNGQTCYDTVAGDVVWVQIGSVSSNKISVSAPPPPPTTYSEMSPGPVHTWTNYTNAGGNEGPSVPSYTWVQIACRLTGFKTQDGNVWWYRIAQSPWSNQYYASADAFYNNGATSGSLIGTPFYDPNVPLC